MNVCQGVRREDRVRSIESKGDVSTYIGGKAIGDKVSVAKFIKTQTTVGLITLAAPVHTRSSPASASAGRMRDTSISSHR